MSKSGIEWTNETWNPTHGCSIVSPGCTNCYAMRLAHRLSSNPKIPNSGYKGTTKATKGGPVWTGVVRAANENTLRKPLAWDSPRLIFVNSMSDIFHESLGFDDIARIWAVMAVTPHHTYQILTKRPDRMRDFLRSDKAIDKVMAEALKHRPDIIFQAPRPR